ncbi:MAG: hypothetical protein ABI946_04275 [Chthoniobacterales bacterium]
MKPWLCLFLLALASCQTTSDHHFANPSPTWTTKSGQLSYQSPKISLIGEVLVRYSKDGAMELTFSKGPGVNLFAMRQDAEFASATGPLARGSWAGPVAKAPERLRGWFGLREQILAGRKSIQTKGGGASFNLRF